MCGICGIISKTGKPVDRSDIDRMTSMVRHRGPDGDGIYLDRNLGLGHRRLSIIDLSDRGAQPMAYGDDLWITYNGEVYNYVELRAELRKLGYSFNNHTDTEVILAAYKHWGEKFVSKLNGMWAFAIYDRKNNKLILSRDRFGIKPLYYLERHDCFVFGSEIKQILSFIPNRRLNRGVLADYLAINMTVFQGETFFEGIKELKPGHLITFDLNDNRWKESRYYELKADKELACLPEREAIDLFSARLRRSVEIRLRSDVRVGICLSGGQDSSAIAALAAGQLRRSSAESFIAITAVSGDPSNDETHYASRVARHCGLEWHKVAFEIEDQFAFIRELVKVQEEPFPTPSISMQYLVFQKAAQVGCKVMLDGQGGDETLVGYERYYPTYILSLPWRERLSAYHKVSQRSKLNPLNLILFLMYFRVANIREQVAKFRGRVFCRETLDRVSWGKLREIAASFGDIRDLQKNEIETQLSHLLKYEDRNSMAHSVEGRLPFLDYHVVETALSLSNHLKVKDGWSKYLLRKASEPVLPNEIVWRRTKVGFEPPRKAFELCDEHRRLMEQSEIVRKSVRKMPYENPSLSWKLFILAAWEREFNVAW